MRNLSKATLIFTTDEVEILRDLLGMHTMLPEPASNHSEEHQHLLATARAGVKRDLRAKLADTASWCRVCTEYPCGCISW